MKPMSISTEFTFSIKRDFINVITDGFEGGLFEDIKVSFGKKSGHTCLKNCHVVYTLKSTVQTVSVNRIDNVLIKKYQDKHKDTFFKRIKDVKKEIFTNKGNSVKVKTIASFVDEISIDL